VRRSVVRGMPLGIQHGRKELRRSCNWRARSGVAAGPKKKTFRAEAEASSDVDKHS